MGTIYHMGKPYLGIPDLKAEVAYVTLRASSWSSGVYTITDARVDADSVQYISPAAGITDDQLSALQSANVQDNGQDAGHMYLKAYGTVPEIDIPIVITFTPGISTKVTDVDQTVIQNSNNPVSGGAVYDFNSYSTTERVVGQWIDGKPIYRKVIQFPSPIVINAQTWTTVMDVSSLSIDYLTYARAYNTGNEHVWNGFLAKFVNNNLQIYNFATYSIGIIILEYTKTTD